MKMLKRLFCFALFVACVAATCQQFASGVSKAEIKTIVNKHNEFRRKIAKGEVSGQPRGVNLKKLKWDAKLAKAAQDIANSCKFAHVAVKDSRFSVGQNLYTSSSTAKDSKGSSWSKAITAWWKEHEQYHFPNMGSGTGHYTQLVWADTSLIGCGYTYFKSKDPTFKYQKLYVCNYGPAGNYVGRAPYKVGNSGCENLC